MIVSFSQCPEQRRKQIWGYQNCAFLCFNIGIFTNVKSVYMSNSFDTLSRNWLSGEIRGARLWQQNPLEIFLKAKTSPRACSVPVHWQRQQKAARWTRATKRGVGTCCSRFAGAEGVIERMKGREGRWDTWGRPLLCAPISVPASPTHDQHWRSTFSGPPTPPTLLYSPGFPPARQIFPYFWKDPLHATTKG